MVSKIVFRVWDKDIKKELKTNTFLAFFCKKV